MSMLCGPPPDRHLDDATADQGDFRNGFGSTQTRLDKALLGAAQSVSETPFWIHFSDRLLQQLHFDGRCARCLNLQRNDDIVGS